MPGQSPAGEPRIGKGSGVLKIASVPEAAAEASRMEDAFKRSKTAQKRTQLKRLAVFASNMASSLSKQKNISAATRERYTTISRIYRDLFTRLKGMETSCK